MDQLIWKTVRIFKKTLLILYYPKLNSNSNIKEVNAIMKVLIIFDTKHGNTQKVAELIADGINSVESNETEVKNVKDIDLNEDKAYDLLLIGSPNHAKSHVKSIKKFINNLPNSQLKFNSFAVFDTYMGKDFEKAAKKMEKQINEKLPDSTTALPGLSIKVGGMKGPIVEEDLSKCKEYGIKLAKKG